MQHLGELSRRGLSAQDPDRRPAAIAGQVDAWLDKQSDPDERLRRDWVAGMAEGCDQWARFKVRYLVVKVQKGHGPIFYWQPDKTLRAAGFLPRRIAERTSDIVDAINEAEGLKPQARCLAQRRRDQARRRPDRCPDLIRRYRQDAALHRPAREHSAGKRRISPR